MLNFAVLRPAAVAKAPLRCSLWRLQSAKVDIVKAGVRLVSSEAKSPPLPVVNPQIAELTVGQYVKVTRVPDSDSLYTTDVSIGSKTLAVTSGLVKFYESDQLEGRKIVVVTNLPPAKLRGITSEAMVLAASKDGNVELVRPPESSQLGDRLHFEGHDGAPVTKMKPKKWRAIQPLLATTADGTVVFSDSALINDTGDSAYVEKLFQANVS